MSTAQLPAVRRCWPRSCKPCRVRRISADRFGNVAIADPDIPPPPGDAVRRHAVRSIHVHRLRCADVRLRAARRLSRPVAEGRAAAPISTSPPGASSIAPPKIWLGGANIYFGTTQEPRATVAPSWHIERDLTDYSRAVRVRRRQGASISATSSTTPTPASSTAARASLFYPCDATASRSSAAAGRGRADGGRCDRRHR